MTIHLAELILAGLVGNLIGTIVMMANYGAFHRLFARRPSPELTRPAKPTNCSIYLENK